MTLIKVCLLLLTFLFIPCLTSESNEVKVKKIIRNKPLTLSFVELELKDLIKLYESLRAIKVESSSLQYSYKTTLSSESEISKQEAIWAIEQIFRLQGLKLLEKENSQFELIRTSIGISSKAGQVDVNIRLKNTLAQLEQNYARIDSTTLVDTGLPQLLSLMQAISGKTILRGYGLPSTADFNYQEKNNIRCIEAFLAMENLLFEKGVVLQDLGEKFITALALKPDEQSFLKERAPENSLKIIPRRRIIRKRTAP